MIDRLLEFDTAFFFLINNVWTNSVFDALMPLLRNKYFWAPLYLFMLTFFLLNFKQRGMYLLVYLGIVVLLCDQISSDIIKPLTGRLRPCNDPRLSEYVRLLVSACGSGLSFTSSHAANHFGVAAFLGFALWRQSRLVLTTGLLWAAVICYAQIYVGVHYPLDVIGGGLVGLLIGAAMALLFMQRFRI